MGKTVRTKKIDDTIIARISQGETLADICRDLGIDRTIVYDWRNADEEFNRRFARARETGFDAIAEEALRIADTPQEGIVEKRGKDGVETVREDMLGHRKLQVETRLKLLAKWDPKRYGELIKVGNPDGSNLELTARILAGNSKVIDVDDD